MSTFLILSLKVSLFNTCILPVLTYGCQSWTLTQDVTSKLATCQHSMERSMLNVKKFDRLKNDVIRNKTKAIDITVNIRRLKWRWAGHMLRGQDKWSKRVTVWYPREGKRARGRELLGTEWLRNEQNGKGWKRPLPTGKQICRE